MEFDVKGRIKFFAEQLRYSVAGLTDKDEDLGIISELGGDGEFILNGIVIRGGKITAVEFDRIKKSYFKAQSEKVVDTSSMFNDSFFFENKDEEEFNDFIKGRLEEENRYSVIDIDSDIARCLRGAISEKYIDSMTEKEIKIKGTKLEERQPKLKQVIKAYIQEGFNPYPLMRKMNKQYNFLDENDTELLEDRILFEKGRRVMEQMEAVSPYKPLFNISEKLGDLVEQHRLLLKDENYSEDKELELQEKIAKYRETLSKHIATSEFDLDELQNVASNKREYLKESEQGFSYNSVNYNMYVGMTELSKCAAVLKMRQEKQTQL